MRAKPRLATFPSQLIAGRDGAAAIEFALIFPEDLREVTEKADAARRRQEPMMSARYRRWDPDGTIHYIQNYQRYFYASDGRTIRSLGANIDITESHRRQLELEALSIRFSIATRAAQAGVWEWQERTNELWWNDTMHTIYALPATERPVHDRVLKLIHPDDIAFANAAWSNALQGAGQLRVQFRLVRSDGAVVHVDNLAVLVTDPHSGDRRLVGISLDISERVAAEQRERRLQKQLMEASHQSGMAEVATGVLHNVGNVLNSLGISVSTAQAHIQAAPQERLERIAAMLDGQKEQTAEFIANDPRVKVLPEYLRALGSQMKRTCDVLHDEVLDRPADARAQLAVGVAVAGLVGDHLLAQRRVGHLHELLVVAARRHRPPRLGEVVEVPVLEAEHEA